MKRILTLAAVVTAILLTARSANVNGDLNVIPAPKEVKMRSAKPVAPADTGVRVIVDAKLMDRTGDEGYLLDIDKKGITVKAATPRGIAWGRQTLRQLRNDDGTYPAVSIADRPDYPIRGFMYDTGRNWVPVETLKHYLDVMALYKLNLFHWHLTDKPAWRIESRVHPRLNDPKFQRQGRDQGKFYTYGEIRDVIAYAKGLGIEVMPEIDMPGHSDFFKTAYGVTMDTERGRRILEECIDEFCTEIPVEMCPWLHIGSDEVNIPDPKGFMAWAEGVARKHGRKTMVWDPGLPADSLTALQVWRGGMAEDGFAAPGVPVVDSSMGYLNIYDPLLLPYKLYFHQICATSNPTGNDLGGILCLWNDVKQSDKSKLAPHNGMAGGVMAFAESVWNNAPRREEDHGRAATLIASADGPDMKKFKAFQNHMAAQRRFFGNGEFDYWQPIAGTPWQVTMANDSVSKEVEAFGDLVDLDALALELGFKPAEMLRCTLTRRFESPNDTVIMFKAGFDNPARSNRISDGIPANGRWENHAVVRINGEVLPGPKWEEPETYSYRYNTWARLEEELPYTDEQLYWMRPAVPVKFKKGVNTIQIEAPRYWKGQHWQAAFIPVTVDD